MFNTEEEIQMVKRDNFECVMRIVEDVEGTSL
jgi:hypothetical protein